ncbi:hypothetical protein [Sulfuriroseicoccus oceanibius]|uniref:Uncharacterized protein n=1 Tax=Sulfuriroseicoccus oceanibius TaxID=2707525 RepID=A0A6B3L8H9_9BACT|nr:hypothetical protein [Sulfuriroseicoccus oceanibius]QQL45182.1 hypothetical protein G3M56_000925 [Sulfuriroseicoccus oceanibius]
MEDQSNIGYQTVGEGMVVCASCNAVQPLTSDGDVPAQCERCGAVFGENHPAGPVAADELEHYEIDCPECGTHYALDIEPGEVVFDCDRCGCAFTVSDDAGEEVAPPAEPAAAAQVPTFNQAMQASAGGKKRRHRAHRRPGGGLKSRAGGISLMLITLAVLGFFIWDAVKDHQEKAADAKAAREARAAASNVGGEGTAEEVRGFRIGGGDFSARAALEQVMTKFLNASDFEARLELCRHPLETRPRMLAFERHTRMAAFDGSGGKLSAGPYVVAAPNGSRFVYALVELQPEDQRHLVVEVTPDGEKLIEWELFVDYSEFPWAGLNDERPRRAFEALVRVERSTRYPRQFPPSEYASYLVYQGSGIDSYAVFVERGSDQHKALEAAFKEEAFPLEEDAGRRKVRWVLAELSLPAERDPSINRIELKRVVVADPVAGVRD